MRIRIFAMARREFSSLRESGPFSLSERKDRCYDIASSE